MASKTKKNDTDIETNILPNFGIDPDDKKFLEKADKELLKQPHPEYSTARGENRKEVWPITLDLLEGLDSLHRKFDIESEIINFCDLYWLEILPDTDLFFDFYTCRKEETLVNPSEEAAWDVFIYLKTIESTAIENNLDFAFGRIKEFLKKKYYEKKKPLDVGNYCYYFNFEIMLVYTLIISQQGEKKGKERLDLLLKKFEEYKMEDTKETWIVTESNGNEEIYEVIEKNLSALRIMAQKYSPYDANKEDNEYNILKLLKSEELSPKNISELGLFNKLTMLSNALCLVDESRIFEVSTYIKKFLDQVWDFKSEFKSAGEKNPYSYRDFYKNNGFFKIFNDDEPETIGKRASTFNTLTTKLIVLTVKKLHDIAYSTLKTILKEKTDEKANAIRMKLGPLFERMKYFKEFLFLRSDNYKGIQDTQLIFTAEYYFFSFDCFEHHFEKIELSNFLRFLSFGNFTSKKKMLQSYLSSFVINICKLIIAFKKAGFSASSYESYARKIAEEIKKHQLAKTENENLARYILLIEIMIDQKCLFTYDTQQELRELKETVTNIENVDSVNQRKIDQLCEFLDALIKVLKVHHQNLISLLEELVNHLKTLESRSPLNLKQNLRKCKEHIESLRRSILEARASPVKNLYVEEL